MPGCHRLAHSSMIDAKPADPPRPMVKLRYHGPRLARALADDDFRGRAQTPD